MGESVALQAALMAYIDIFYTWAIFAAVLIPVMLLLIRRVAPSGMQSTAMH